MKNFAALMSVFLLFAMVSVSNNTQAQTKRQLREAAHIKEIKAIVDSVNFTFKADFAFPAHGASWALTSDYDLQVSKDSIACWMPYFGGSFAAPLDPSESGIHFNTKQFTYDVNTQTDGGWEVIIKPADVRDLVQLLLTISADGTSELIFTFKLRDPIRFTGFIEKPTKDN